VQELEKQPLAVVPAEPSELLDKDRYKRSSRQLSPREEVIGLCFEAAEGASNYWRQLGLCKSASDAC